MRNGFIILLIAFAGSVSLTGCTDNSISSNPFYKLHFSQDTIAFDTVFCTIGSATSKVVIYNRNPKPLSISSISLTNGASSGFQMIVDGTIATNNQLSNIEIRAHDSLYVFVSVTVNPTLQDSPLLIQDSIVCITNGNRQSVKLTAYGQDVVIFRSKTIHNDTILAAKKPYLIYDYLAIDNGKTLTINPGATLYFHKNASLKIYGNLKAAGEPKARITLRGDRLDKLSDDVPYSYLSGQWNGLQILGTQSSASLNYVTMISGKSGIAIPNGTPTQMPDVTINNTRIQNFDSCGLVASNANLSLLNSEISNCKSGCLRLTGGNYTFTHNTIANFYNDNYAGKRRDGTPSVTLLNGESGRQNQAPAPLRVQFINCVITGSAQNEILISDTTRNTPLKYTFDHCYLMSKSFQSSSLKSVQWGNTKDQLFIRTTISSKGYCDFRPTENAPIRKKADLQVSQQSSFCFDMNGTDRLWNGTPDLGAYQWQGE
ncbi:MAG: hypothetical protein H6Q17_2006 [Bacteroidetes bacterium]|nr:hypothetical protein [Bacteroidota bacterium]